MSNFIEVDADADVIKNLVSCSFQVVFGLTVQGSIILGTGGDNSNFAVGTFMEGVMVSGFASDATDSAVHASIVAAGYGR